MGWRSMFRRSRRKLPEPPPNEDSELERFFTDAEEARARFRELLDSRPLAKRIVVVHGVGAVGGLTTKVGLRAFFASNLTMYSPGLSIWIKKSSPSNSRSFV